MEHYSERIINISDLESKIRSARATSNLLLKCIQSKEYFRAEKLARQLSLEMHELDEFELIIERRKEILNSKEADSSEFFNESPLGVIHKASNQVLRSTNYDIDEARKN